MKKRIGTILSLTSLMLGVSLFAGINFNESQITTSTTGIQSPAIIENSDSSLTAAWVGAPVQGDKWNVNNIWVSSLKSGETSWSAPVVASNCAVDGNYPPTPGSDRIFPVWDPVLCTIDNVQYIFLKAGLGTSTPPVWPVSTPAAGTQKWPDTSLPWCCWGYYVSANASGDWNTTPVELPSGILGSHRTKPIHITDGNQNPVILFPASYQSMLYDSRKQANVYYSSVSINSLSKDEHGNWVWKIGNPINSTSINVIQAAVQELDNGTILLVCSTDTGDVYKSSSKDHGVTWSSLKQIIGLKTTGAIDMAYDGDSVYLVYNDMRPNKHGELTLLSSKNNGNSWLQVWASDSIYTDPHMLMTANGTLHIVCSYNIGTNYGIMDFISSNN